MREILSATQSLCPVCLDSISAEIVADESGVYLEKACSVHGTHRTIVWRGSLTSYQGWLNDAGCAGRGHTSGPHRQLANGCPFDCGLCEAHTGESCSAALMVTNRCNCNCPVCFTACGKGDEPDPSLDELEKRLRFYLDTSGAPFPLELCGGEPTIRPDLSTVVSMARDMGFKHIQMNTNGIRLGDEEELASSLKDAGVTVIYLGFNGLDDKIYSVTAGYPLYSLKMKAIENCARAGLAIVLVPVLIPGENLEQIGPIINLAKKWMPHIKGVHFQPISYFGRYAMPVPDGDRLTIPEILDLLAEQTKGEIKQKDFLPPGSEHPLCSFQAFYILSPKGKLQALTIRQPRFNNDGAAERVRTVVTKAWSSGPMPTLTVGGMLFQDVWNVDIERLKRCSIHIIGRDQKLTPLCAKYLTAQDGCRLYPGLS
jgi:7,8-dihydro-6-hydroxymethylpterin dimethyltransferase